MDILAIRAQALATAFATMGVAAIVTPPGGAPIATQILWILYARVTYAMDDAPAAALFQRREQRRVVSLLRSAVPSVPLETVITAPEVSGGPVLTWTVDGFERLDAWRVDAIVVPG